MPRAWFLIASASLSGATILAAACLPGSGPPLEAQDDAGPPNGPSLGDDASVDARHDVDLGDRFGIDGLVPSHGPWTGGTRAKLTGRGFPSTLRVWIGGTELDSSRILASDPTRAAIETPPGAPGPADVKIRDDALALERVLPEGFTYDAFVLVPDSGATTGGTRVALNGSGTSWASGATVTVGGTACGNVKVLDSTHIECTTPPGAPGTRDVAVANADGSLLQARDAFTYSDSPDGYRGGLGGGALSGTLRVLVFDAFVGTPIGGARAIAGGSLGGAVVGVTGANGIVQLTDATLTGKMTVTVAAKCHQPITFIDVPVDTVTAYLSPTMAPSCADGDPPSIGGHGVNGGEIDGELVWPGGVELAKGGWSTVPAPIGANERQVAYVFTAAPSPVWSFQLPPPDQGVTPTSSGVHGYAYTLPASPGNQTVYALAGIENRSVTPPRFTPYVMGVARGVAVQPQVRLTGVDILMSTLLDHTLTLAPSPPAPTPRGPDRLVTQLGVSLGTTGFAILPGASRMDLLPMSATMGFPGVPALDGALTGEQYVIAASAVTGPSSGAPASVVARVRTSDSNAPVAVGGFLPVPAIAEPGPGAWAGTHVSFTAQGAYDVAYLTIASGGGLVTWSIVAPPGSTSFDVPDLRAIPGDPLGLVPGPIQAVLYVARIDAFAYGRLRYGQLGTGSWSAYAYDTVDGSY